MSKDIQNLIKKQKKKNKRRKIITGLKKAIEIGSSITSTFLMMRDKPKPLDYFSVGLSTLNTGIKIHDEIGALVISDPRSFFDGTKHYPLPYSLEKTIFKFAKNPEVLMKAGDLVLVCAYLEDLEVYWVQNKNTQESPFCKIEDKENIIDKVGEILWKYNGSKNIAFDKSGFLVPSDEELGFDVIETKAMKDLEYRMTKFMKANKTRSYLLEGPPGTGKTAAASYLIKKMELNSFRTTISAMCGVNYSQAGKMGTNLDILLRALRPDMIIIDDIDENVVGSSSLLRLFEVARKYCKIIMATCNNKNKLGGAMLRVKRFDDHITIDYLDKEVIKDLLDKEDHDLIETFEKWPIAYIQDFKVVKEVMGPQRARKEVQERTQRIEEIEKDIKRKFSGFHIPGGES